MCHCTPGKRTHCCGPQCCGNPNGCAFCKGRTIGGAIALPVLRSRGERIRLRHSITRLRATLANVERCLTLGGPIGFDSAQALTSGAIEVAMQIAKADAYELAERDAKGET